MKRLVWLLTIWSAVAAAQTTSSITGTLKDLSGALVTSGKVTFTLQPSRDTTISGIARFAPQTITCLINGSGLIKAQDGTSTCTLTMNTALQPPGTYYRVDVWPYSVKTSSFTFYAVLSSYDWSTVVPTPTTSPAANFVDVFSNQTIGGNKTFSGSTVFNSTTTFAAVIATMLNSTTVYATAGESVAHAVSRLPSGGGKVIFDCGIYPSGSVTVSTANIMLQGCGMPNYNSATAPTALVGGTVIQGPVSAQQGADHFVVRDLGVDTGSVWTSGSNAGVATDGLTIFNNGQVVGASPVQSPIFENVACLGSSSGAAFHCMIMENVTDGLMRNVRAVYDTHGIVLKGNNSRIDGADCSGNATDCIILISNSYAVSGGLHLTNFNAHYLSTPGDSKGIIVQANSAALAGVNISNGHITGIGGTGGGIQLQGLAVGSALTSVNISNVYIDYTTPSPSGYSCLQYAQYVVGVNISNLTCSNYYLGITASSPVGGFTGTFNVVNATFTNIGNNAVEAFGRWTMANGGFNSVTGTALTSDANATLDYCNVYFNTVGANTAGTGTITHCA